MLRRKLQPGLYFFIISALLVPFSFDYQPVLAQVGPECGNIIVEPPEECDDGDESAECGNGAVETGEQCDDGNLADGDGCDSACQEEIPVCGNGLVETGEDCDDIDESAECNADCTLVACGDGILNTTAGEQCDDGNTADGDGCDNQCLIEQGEPTISPGDIVINEIMQNPAAVANGAGEWLELFNTTSAGIDLNGCVISDNNVDSHTISSAVAVPAGGYAVLARNGDSGSNGGVTPDYVYGGFILANAGDEVVLTCADTEIDRVEYDDGATFPDPNGASMILSDPGLDNNVGANWCVSTSSFGDGDLGTPGGQNDSCGQGSEEPVCGNGVKEGDEECDGADGVTSGYTCTDSCTLEPESDGSSGGVTSGFSINPGAGEAPIIKAKWEMNRSSDPVEFINEASSETGADDDIVEPGAQFLPSGKYQVDKLIWVCAIATDPDGLADIDEGGAVYADIFYPDDYGFHEPSDSPDDFGVNGCGQQMSYELELIKLDKQDGINLFCQNIKNGNNNLPTFSPGFDYNEICNSDGELQKETAAVYCKYTGLSYEDPAGMYTVQTYAVDKAGVDSAPLINDFEYLPVTAFAVDFDEVNYGNVKLNTRKKISGDLEFGTADKPTVRNVGNTRLKISVWQNDMGLGKTEDGAVEWNIEWEARVGSRASFVSYEPEQTSVFLDEIVNLSESEEMDFSLFVKKFPLASGDVFSGQMELGASQVDFRACEPAKTQPTNLPTHQPPYGNGKKYPGAFVRS